jgi:hypothetical protein
VNFGGIVVSDTFEIYFQNFDSQMLLFMVLRAYQDLAFLLSKKASLMSFSGRYRNRYIFLTRFYQGDVHFLEDRTDFSAQFSDSP